MKGSLPSNSKLTSASCTSAGILTIVIKGTAYAGTETVNLRLEAGFSVRDPVSFVVTVTGTPAADISFTKTSSSELLQIDASDHVQESHSSYTPLTPTCGNASSVSSSIITVSRSSCVFSVTPVAEGTGQFTTRITSNHGTNNYVDATFDVVVSPDSVLQYSAPQAALDVQVGASRTVDLSDYMSDGDYTISCSSISASNTLIALSNVSGCSVDMAGSSVTSGSSEGSTGIMVTYSSDGSARATSAQTISVCTLATSIITFVGPTDLKVGTNRTQTIDALDYVTETHESYTITCDDATLVDTVELDTVTRDSTGNGCVFTIDPKNVQGSASFTCPMSLLVATRMTGRLTFRWGRLALLLLRGRLIWWWGIIRPGRWML